MIGNFKITKIIDGEKLVEAIATKYEGVRGRFYLPVLNRQSVSDIAVGDVFFGVLDEASGYGAFCVMLDGHDFGHFFQYSLELRDELSVMNNVTVKKGDVKTNVGDVIATTVSLKNHMHSLSLMPPQDMAILSGGVITFMSTGVPAALEFTATTTSAPIG